ncbi:MAG: TonB-dependent receptor [Melioribacteraceae bacterium]|nr:TonB-dependent receptor [Melioribacteraceae bacterium]
MFNKLSYWGVLLITLFAVTANSQTFTLKGKVTNSQNNQPLPNSNIFITEINSGSSTDMGGIYFIENLKDGIYTITCSYLGFQTISKSVTITEGTTLNFSLTPKSILLNETVVSENKASLRETPIAFSEKSSRDVQRSLGSQDVPFLLQSTPSIYISPQGGGTGDLRMSLRGFDHTHFAVMINGIPINNPENGEIYWSNWSGISDVVDNIQVQRGLTTNPYSSSAIGGLINVQTMGVNSNNTFVKLSSEVGSDNFRKFSVAFNQHIIPNKLTVTALLSKKDWDGYADQTWLNEYTYYIGIGGVFGNNSLELQAIGSPQEHGQRKTMQKKSTWDKYGKRYNADWGYMQGKSISMRDNKFHKPTINLNHNWKISDNLLMTNLLYYTPGEGGGTVPPWAQFSTTEDGQIDFDKEYNYNSNNIDSTYSTTRNKTENALRFFSHTHQWFGFLSTLNYSFSNSKLTLGIDFRDYEANNHQEVSNLLGGDYTIGWAGYNNFGKLLVEGDTVDFNANSYAKHFGGFLQYEFKNRYFSYYANMSLSNTKYNRIDFYNFTNDDPNRETGWKNFIGYSIKSGLNYNLNQFNNFYFNFGYISKPPLAYNVFDFSNKLYKNVMNENVLSFETGYGLKTNKLFLVVNAFYTIWKEKAFNRTEADWSTGRFFFYNISGADSKHIGIELEANYKIANSLTLIGMLSTSSNKYTSDALTAKSPEDNPTEVEYSDSFVNGIYLANFPMTTASIGFLYNSRISSNTSIYVNPILNYKGRQYAQFDPTLRADKNEAGINSWMLPNSYLLNIHIGVEYQLDNSIIKRLSVNFHLFNLLNESYVVDAIDGVDHLEDSALLWYGRDRWWNVGLTFLF